MKNSPLVSIIIPTHNRADLLPRALNSAINQTYKNIEIIVCDDGSKDNTEEVIQKFLKKDSRIKYIKNEKPMGGNVARNRGILVSSGKFLTTLDDDDEFLPCHIELLVENYDSKFAFIIANLIFVYDSHTHLYQRKAKQIALEDTLDNCVVCPHILVEKSRVVEVGMYDEQFLAAQDYDLYIRLMLRYGDVKVVPKHTIKMYQEETRSRISTRVKERFSGYLKFYLKYKNLMKKEHKITHLTRLYKIRKKHMSISTFITLLFSKYELKKYKNCLVSLKKYEPKIRYKYQRDFVSQINSIKQDKHKYILYGYGELGEFILPIIKEKVIAIIDESDKYINFKDIESKPLIQIESLSNYPDDVIILATPIIYKKEIKKDLSSCGKRVVFLDNIKP